MQTSSRVAFNTIIQYVQLIVNVLVGLITVRVVLNALGKEDYGIYDVIAGIITLLAFIKTSLSQTSIRFLSVSLGENDEDKTRNTFAKCLWIHFFIAIIIVLILALIGVFLFKGFLNIPDSRIQAAQIVYYGMLISLFTQVSTSPFTALIISHEKFVYNSIINILDSFLKLGIAYFLTVTMHDKLVVYGLLMALISVINALAYIIYVFIKYKKEISFSIPDTKSLKEISGFAGWTLFDVFASTATRQGYVVMLNKFFGPMINASFAISRQIEGHIYSVSAAVVNSMKPQIMMSKGQKNDERMLRLSMTAGKFGFSLMSFIAVPLIIMMPEILELWLKSVPDNTVVFSRLLVAACMIEQLTRGLVFANQAIGNIKWFSIVVSTVRFLALPFSCVALYCGYGPIVAIVIFLVFESLGSFLRIIIISRLSDLKPSLFFKDVLARISLPFLIATISAYFSKVFISNYWSILIVILVFSLLFCCLMFFAGGFTRNEKKTIEELFSKFTLIFLHRN